MNKTLAVLSVGAAAVGAPSVALAYNNVAPEEGGRYVHGDELHNFGQSIDRVFDAIEGDINTEAGNRDAADKALGGRIDQEIKDREAGDKALGGRIDQEIKDRDSAISSAIDKEVGDRNSAISGAISKEVDDRNSAISGAVSQEKSEREAADKALGGRIDQEVKDRDAADKALEGKITDEARARDEADAATLNSANKHADEAASNAESNAKDWAEQQAKKAEENATKKAEQYTDKKADETKGWVEDELSAQDKKIKDAKDAANGAQEEIFNEKLAREKADHDETLARERAIHEEQLAREKQVQQVFSDSKKYSDQVGAETLVKANDYTDQEVGKERYERIQGDKETLAAAKEHTNQKFSQLKSMIDKNKKQANAGIAGALAASQIPQVSQGKDFSLGAGVGSYKGESSLAVGVSGRLSDRVVTRAAVTLDTTKNVGVGVGISYEW